MKKEPDYSDKPTIIVEFDSLQGEVFGISAKGMTLPEGHRLVLRDYAKGEQDENGLAYEDTVEEDT